MPVVSGLFFGSFRFAMASRSAASRSTSLPVLRFHWSQISTSSGQGWADVGHRRGYLRLHFLRSDAYDG